MRSTSADISSWPQRSEKWPPPPSWLGSAGSTSVVPAFVVPKPGSGRMSPRLMPKGSSAGVFELQVIRTVTYDCTASRARLMALATVVCPLQ